MAVVSMKCHDKILEMLNPKMFLNIMKVCVSLLRWSPILS